MGGMREGGGEDVDGKREETFGPELSGGRRESVVEHLDGAAGAHSCQSLKECEEGFSLCLGLGRLGY